MQNVDARKILKKSFELLELYPVLRASEHTTYPNLSVYTGYDQAMNNTIRNPEPIDNIYTIEKNTGNKFKYKITREDSESGEPNYINTPEDFLKLIKNSPITAITLLMYHHDDDEANREIVLFRCEQRNCPEIQNWARSTIRKRIVESPEFNRYTTSVSTMHRRGEFYKNPMTGEPISKADRIDVDNRFIKARNEGRIKTDYFKLKSRIAEIRRDQIPKIVQILDRLEKPSQNIQVLNDNYTQILELRAGLIALQQNETIEAERQHRPADEEYLKQLGELEQRTLSSLKKVVEIIQGIAQQMEQQHAGQEDQEDQEEQVVNFGKTKTIDRDIKYLSGL